MRPSKREHSAERGKRVLILSPFPPGMAPSQRFRFEQYLHILEEEGLEIVQRSFWDEASWKVLYKPGHRRRKVWGLARGFARRIRDVVDARGFDYVFIHLEATPLGPPAVEALLFLLGKKVVYDIDDSIFMSPESEQKRPLFRLLKWRSKVGFITQNAHRVSAANSNLADWAKHHNLHTSYIPTTVDPEVHRPRAAPKVDNKVVVGWTGTFSTAGYLDLVRSALRALQARHDFRLRVICNVDPGFSDLQDYEYVPWRAETEIEDLHAIDIGIMPTPDTQWNLGKLGFKAIQYAALGLPTVASNVGTIRQLIDDGKTGFIVENEPDAWIQALETLIEDPSRRLEMGRAARDKVGAFFTIPAQAPMYLELFRG